MLSDEKLRQMSLDARHSPEAEHTVWWMLIARAVERAAYERAAQECHAQKGGLSSEWGDGHDTGCDDCFAAIRALGRQQ